MAEPKAPEATNDVGTHVPDTTDQPQPPPAPERPMPANVIQAIARVMEEMPPVGKDGTASAAQGGYSFRSIEAITAAAQHLMGRYGVVFVPRVIQRETIQLQVGGKPWTEEQLTIKYNVYGPGGVDDRIEVGPLIALGRDNVDKGTNKCMTQAFKYALLQVLCVGDNKDDADGAGAQADAHGQQNLTPDEWAAANGWMDMAEQDEARKRLAAGLANAPTPAIKTAFGKWYRDQTNAPPWNAAWPQPWFEVVQQRLHELVGAHVAGTDNAAPDPSPPAEAPQEAQDGQETPGGTDTPPTPGTPADGPENAPGGVQMDQGRIVHPTSEAGDAMPWDGLPPTAAAPADDPDPRQAVVDYVNAQRPAALQDLCHEHEVDPAGTVKAIKTRLSKALIAKGWTPPPAE